MPVNGQASDLGPARTFAPRECLGAGAHHLGGRPRPEVLGNRDPPVRTSHFPRRAAPVGSEPAPNGGPRVAREGRFPLDRQATSVSRPGDHTMKNRLMAQLFGYGLTVAALAAFVVPNWGKIW